MVAAWLLGWMMIAAVSTYGVWGYWRRVERQLVAPVADGVVLLIPIKGGAGQGEALARFIEACLAQRGVALRLVVAVEAESDLAVPTLARLAAARANMTVVFAGRAEQRGQKVHNLLAGLGQLRPEDRFVVFADADIDVPPDWLAQLLRPLLLGHAELASGYRWILPADHHWASRCCALMDWGIATAGRSKRWNLCWGGSTAITRQALDRIDLPRRWAHSALDDLVLGHAARRAGFTVHAPLHVLVPSPVRHGLRSLFAFGRRQYLFVRVHAPLHWCCAGITLVVPLVAGVAATVGAIRGEAVSMACLGVAFLLQQGRAALRVRIAQRVLAAGAAAQSAALMRRDRWKLPAIHVLHTAIWLSSAVGRTMVWAGRRYRLTGFARIEVVGDPDARAPTHGASARTTQ